MMRLLLALLALANGNEAPRARLEVVAVVVGAEPVAARGSLAVREEGKGETPVVETSFEIPGHLVVEVGAEGVCRLELKAPGYWCDTTSVFVPPGGASAELRCFRVGTIAGRVSVGRGEHLPEEVELRWNPLSAAREGASGVPSGSVRCRVTEDGTFACDVPVGTVDVRVGAPGFVAHYRWGQAVTTRRTTDLGRLFLVRGASVSGFVETAKGTPPAASCEVELRPEPSGSRTSPGEEERLRRRSLRTRPDDRGFFHLTGVPPGAYTLEARLEGLVPARVPVTVLEDRETHIPDPLRLRPPTRFVLQVDPPMPPDGGRWRFELVELAPMVVGGRRSVLAQGELDDTGHWEGSVVAGGSLRLGVLGEGETRWASLDVDVSENMPPVTVQVPVVAVHGRVTLAGEPLVATLRFLSVPRSLEAVLFSDADGRFAGHLPREGEWMVEFATSDITSEQAGPFEVVRRPGEASARLDIALHRTKVGGRVVDEEGTPVPDTTVEVQWPTGRIPGAPPREARTQAGEGGRWELRGIPPGEVVIVARGAEGESDAVGAEVQEEKDLSITLTLHRWLDVAGRLEAGGVGVPGALVMVMPPLGSTRAAKVIPVTSDATGEFRTRVHSTVRDVVVCVFARGYAMRMLRMAVEPGTTATIELGTRGGTLELGGEGSARENPPLVNFALVHDNAAIPVTLLGRWASLHQGVVEPHWMLVPQMAPGTYALCPFAASAVALPGGCTEGYLPPGGTLTLKPPK